MEKRKLDERRSLTSAQMVAFWGTPRIAPEVPRRRDASIAGLEKRREAARQFAAQSGLPPPDPSGGPSGISFEVEGQPPADSEPTQDHRAWLKEQAEKFIAESAEAETRRAAYAAATAALTAEAAQLDTALDVARARARAAEPAARKAVLVRAQEGQRIQREKKERELQLLQRRANDMVRACPCHPPTLLFVLPIARHYEKVKRSVTCPPSGRSHSCSSSRSPLPFLSSVSSFGTSLLMQEELYEERRTHVLDPAFSPLSPPPPLHPLCFHVTPPPTSSPFSAARD